MANVKTATVFGGTGFVGRQVVRELALRGIRIKVATRIPESAYFLRPCGTVGQVVPVACDYSNEAIKAVIEGSDYVVNCVGVLYEKGRSTFTHAHVEIPTAIANACKKSNVRGFVHISALGIEKATSKYAQSKRDGEKAVRKEYAEAVILRPSIIFGENDNFFNLFARLSGFLPMLPLIGGGRTKFQPVYVGDVADAVVVSLGLGKKTKDPRGRIYELGGPDVVSFKEIYQIIFKYTGRRRSLMAVPFFVAKTEAFFLSLYPKPLLTPDQVESLKTDSIVSDSAMGLTDLGITPTSMDLVVPEYLAMYRAGGKFGAQAI